MEWHGDGVDLAHWKPSFINTKVSSRQFADFVQILSLSLSLSLSLYVIYVYTIPIGTHSMCMPYGIYRDFVVFHVWFLHSYVQHTTVFVFSYN